MHESIPFSSPVCSPRPRGSRVVEAFSPKLGRRLQCFGRQAFNQWIRLESDPSVLTFCERPLTLSASADPLLIDFWVRYRDRDLLLVVGDACPVSDTAIASTTYSIHTVPPAEITAAQIWIGNWERMLPCIVACRQLITASLTKTIVQLVSEPMSLSRIEREFSGGDLSLIRAVLFNALHHGLLQAPQLAVAPLSYLTLFEPVKNKP